MATYTYPIDVTVYHSGTTSSSPSCSSPFLILVTTGTTQSAANTALSASSTSYSCFEITGVSGENRLKFQTTASTCYAAVCAVRLGSLYAFNSSACSRVYTSGASFSIYCTTTEDGNRIVSRAVSGNTAFTSHGVPYYKKTTVGTLSYADKPLMTRGTAASCFSVSSGFDTNLYIPLKYVGFSGSVNHAGSISARTASSYVIPVALYVSYGLRSLGTIEIYTTDVENGYNYYMQDSMQIWHSGNQISGDGGQLACYTDRPMVYVGVHVDYPDTAYQIRMLRNNSQVYGGNLTADQWVGIDASLVNSTTEFTINIGT